MSGHSHRMACCCQLTDYAAQRWLRRQDQERPQPSTRSRVCARPRPHRVNGMAELCHTVEPDVCHADELSNSLTSLEFIVSCETVGLCKACHSMIKKCDAGAQR